MSDSSIRRKRRSLAQLWPLTIVSLGLALSLTWAALLVWLVIRAFGSLI